MLVFPSLEWGEALRDSLNANEEYQEAGANWEGALTLVCLREEGKLDRDLHFYMDLYRGKVREVRQLSSPEEMKSTYTLIAKYSVWKEILQGKYDGIDAIKRGKIKFKGNLVSLMWHARAPKIMLRVMREMKTQFIDEVKVS